VPGARFILDVTPQWFVLANGNLRGFWWDNVSFTGMSHAVVG
jgi:hypothetical protein